MLDRNIKHFKALKWMCPEVQVLAELRRSARYICSHFCTLALNTRTKLLRKENVTLPSLGQVGQICTPFGFSTKVGVGDRRSGSFRRTNSPPLRFLQIAFLHPRSWQSVASLLLNSPGIETFILNAQHDNGFNDFPRLPSVTTLGTTSMVLQTHRLATVS